jgi:hypothetical protein
MNQVYESVSEFHWWIQEVLEFEIFSHRHDPLRVLENHSLLYLQVLL